MRPGHSRARHAPTLPAPPPPPAGYFRDAEKTAEALDADGWLHSGDIGLWDSNGNLRIIDRKKNIFKLSQGEYVAPEKIENLLLKSSLIGQVFVHGDSLHAVLVAVIVPNADNVKPWAKALGKSDDLAVLAADADLKKAIAAEITTQCKDAKLSSFEVPKDFVLDPVAWTPDDLLTPSFKLKRADAKKKYQDKIDALYDALNDTVAGAKGLKQG